MRKRLQIIYRLGVKELFSLRYDPVLVVLILYTFTIAIYSVATGVKIDVENAAIAVVDEDRSALSRRIVDGLRRPFFQPPVAIEIGAIDRAMDIGRFTFVVDIPPDFARDVVAGRRPAIQVNVDATAMSQAGNGARYIANIIAQESTTYLQHSRPAPPAAVRVVDRVLFNPNQQSAWFMAVMQLIENITLLAIVLTGAALIREREHGTIEHLLAMPLKPIDIMIAKMWANGLIIVVAAALSMWLMVEGVLGVPIRGSLLLFLGATAVYLFSVTALGILLATLVRSMPQFGLLAIPVFMVMNLLSGSTTPLDSMPRPLQLAMQLAPSTHFIAAAQAILFRGAGLALVWPQLAAVAAIGAGLFALALLRFRRSLRLAQT